MKIIKKSAAFVLFLILSVNGFPQQNLNLLEYRDASGVIRTIKTSREWQKHRPVILEEMQQVMGTLPEAARKVPADMKVEEETVIDGVRRWKISFASEAGDRVPAYLLMPLTLSGPAPGILCLHQTVKSGKGEPAGLDGSPNLHYAFELAKRGYVTLAPDYPNFGDYKYDAYSNGYESTTMKGIWNHMAAIDLLQSLPEVDDERIGCIGHSLGGHNSLFVAAFDNRIKVVVTSCGFNSFFKYMKGDLTGWSHKGYMPRIASLFEKNPARMPFNFTEVLASMAPRAVFINAPVKDINFEVSGVYDCFNAAMPVYKLFRKTGKLVMKNPDCGHDFPPEVREEAYRFIDKELKFNKNNKK